MIRRSKRQHKDTTIEQEPSALLDSHMEMEEHKDDAETSPARDQKRQTKKDKTKRELDSVVLNLQEELQKAASSSSQRPKRERKITEKAKLEMKAKQSKAKNALKKIESEKESPEEENEKIKGERGVSKSKSKEPEHKNIKDKKITQTKAHTNSKDVEKKKNGEQMEKQNGKEDVDSDSSNSDREDQIELEAQDQEEVKGKMEESSVLRQKIEMSKAEENKDIQVDCSQKKQEQPEIDLDDNKENTDKIQQFQEQEGDDDNLSSNSIRNKARKMPWSEEEDRLVIKLVEQHGPQKWTFIAQHIPGRIGKQCRERWHNHLNPRISKLAWCEDEEWLLFLCHRLKGNKWADITQYLLGRTDNAIKNHWNSSMKKRLPELIHRYAGIRRQEKVEYELADEYKNIEQELLTALMELPQHPDDQDSLLLLKQISNTSKNPKNSEAQNNNNNTPKKQQPKNNTKKQNKINNPKNAASQGNNGQDSLKHIIESIPQEGEAFKSFRKQLLICQDEFYAQHTPSAKIAEDSQLLGFSGQNTVFDTPQAVGQMVQQNPAFADLVKTALKYSSDAKNISSYRNMSSKRNTASVDRIQLSATSTLLSAAPRGMEDEDEQDQGQQQNKDGDNDREDGSNRDRDAPKDEGNNNVKDVNKKKRGRKPKEIPSQTNKEGLKKKIGAAPPGFIHPMYLMNLPHGQPHPFYHPRHGYLPPPPPHIMAQHMQGYSHQFPHGMPPPPPPFMRNGQMVYPHQLPIRTNGQGNGVIPPLHRLIHPGLTSGAASHLPPSRYVQDEQGDNNNNSQDSCSQEELQDIEANSSFQTPQKYQKNNHGERSAFKPLTPQTDGASCGVDQSSKLVIQPATNSALNDKELMVKDSAFREEDIEDFARLAGSSFSKENINPNILLHTSKQALNQITGTTGLVPPHASSTSRFATPNKYETPSKLLDFGSEPRINGSSVDNYFRYSSNHKSHHHHAGTLYASHANNFNRSSNSAFKCYPQLDFQEGASSAKKQTFS